MTDTIVESSQLNSVKIAGIAYLLALLIPTLSTIFIFSKLIVPGAIGATVNNIMANELMFRIGITSDLIMATIIVLHALVLFVILKTINKNLALLALCWRLGEASLVCVAALCGLITLLVLNGKVYSVVFDTAQLQAIAGLFLDIRYAVYFSIVYIFLGLGSIVFNYLFFKSNYIPRLLAVLGMFSYLLLLIYAFFNILIPYYAGMMLIQMVFFLPSCIFEIIIGLWLILKGIQVEGPVTKETG